MASKTNGLTLNASSVSSLRKKVDRELIATKSVDVVVTAIRKRFGPSSVETLEDQAVKGKYSPVAGWVPLRLWSLSYLISDFRGLPLGRTTAIWGPEQSGKSSISHFCMRDVQDEGGLNMLLDFDQTHDAAYSLGYGVDPKRLILPDIDTIEDGLDVIHDAFDSLYGSSKERREKRAGTHETKKGPVFNVIWDSVAASASRALMESDSASEHNVADVARALSSQLKKMRVYLKRRPAHVWFINERRDNMGGKGGFAPQYKMPHGHALKFQTTTILRTAAIESLKKVRKGRDVSTGCVILVSADKAKLGVNRRQAKVVLSYDKGGKGGPDVAASNLLFLKDNKFVEPRGADGIRIRGLRDIGSIRNGEWPAAMLEHQAVILDMLRAELGSDPRLRKVNDESEAHKTGNIEDTEE